MKQVKQKQQTLQAIINKAQTGGGGGESSIPELAFDNNGTVTLHNGATQITGSITAAHSGFINLSINIDYMGIYPDIEGLGVDVDISLLRDSLSTYIIQSLAFFQAQTMTQQITNNNFSICIPVNSGDQISILFASKGLDQSKCATIINYTTVTYVSQKYV